MSKRIVVIALDKSSDPSIESFNGAIKLLKTKDSTKSSKKKNDEEDVKSRIIKAYTPETLKEMLGDGAVAIVAYDECGGEYMFNLKDLVNEIKAKEQKEKEEEKQYYGKATIELSKKVKELLEKQEKEAEKKEEKTPTPPNCGSHVRPAENCDTKKKFILRKKKNSSEVNPIEITPIVAMMHNKGVTEGYEKGFNDAIGFILTRFDIMKESIKRSTDMFEAALKDVNGWSFKNNTLKKDYVKDLLY